jgi:hypothetical protein
MCIRAGTPGLAVGDAGNQGVPGAPLLGLAGVLDARAMLEGIAENAELAQGNKNALNERNERKILSLFVPSAGRAKRHISHPAQPHPLS